MKQIRSSGEARGAFTLIEIMVVVVLIGIMTAVIIPEMKGTYEDALLRSTGRDLVNACNLAYSRAVSFNQPHRARVDAATGKYFIEKRVREQGQEGFVPIGDVPGGEGSLDRRIRFEFRRAGENQEPGQEPSPALPGDSPPSGEESVIGFYPDGTADSVEATLQDREGFRLVLRINPTTARVRVTALGRESLAAETGGMQ